MADKGTYEVVVAMEECGKYDTFKEAFKVFYEKVTELVKNGTSMMVLNEACWIKPSYLPIPLKINMAAERAINEGLLNEEGDLIG